MANRATPKWSCCKTFYTDCIIILRPYKTESGHCITEDFDTLVEELIRIGRDVEDSSYHNSGYLRPRDTAEESREPRAREIGRKLYSLGGDSIKEMQRAHKAVVATLGGIAGAGLNWAWHEIGMEEWQAGSGECWMA